MAKRVDEELLKQLWLEGVLCKDIALRLGISKSYVHKLVTDRLKLPLRHRGSRSFSGKEAEQLYREGWPTTKLGKRHGVPHHTVSRVLKLRGVVVMAKRVEGSAETATVIRMRRSGMSYKDISKATGLTVGMVGNRVRRVLGLRWRGW